MKALLPLLLAVALAACDREARRLSKAASPVERIAPSAKELQAGQPGPGLVETAAARGYDEANAWEISEGKRLFRWFNCNGCHGAGGGGMGPALMDARWRYGSEPGAIFATIMEGRPNGMPSFRGRIPEDQAWQLVLYVRSMSGQARADGLAAVEPELRRDHPRPLPPTGPPPP
jgi:cytochrome c oxidase cbb3-type subunit 3